MRIKEELVVEVVTEASKKMSDANYSAVMVGGFVQTQGAAAQYVSAHADELGGPEGVVNTIFHAALIAECFKRANNRTVREMSFDELNHVATDTREEELKAVQPAILEYIHANVELDAMKSVVMLLALAMEWVS